MSPNLVMVSSCLLGDFIWLRRLYLVSPNIVMVSRSLAHDQASHDYHPSLGDFIWLRRLYLA